jgi:hypothetical protein
MVGEADRRRGQVLGGKRIDGVGGFVDRSTTHFLQTKKILIRTNTN